MEDRTPEIVDLQPFEARAQELNDFAERMTTHIDGMFDKQPEVSSAVAVAEMLAIANGFLDDLDTILAFEWMELKAEIEARCRRECQTQAQV
ncbi:MAG: hypothetical protein LAN36_11515 [Acidobacteriia bacterium]|nr:hypothetical protein [Terriglobia bacterium]